MKDFDRKDIPSTQTKPQIPDLSGLPDFSTKSDEPYSFSTEEEQGELLDSAHFDREPRRSFLISEEPAGSFAWFKRHAKSLILLGLVLIIVAVATFLYKDNFQAWLSAVEQGITNQATQAQQEQKQAPDDDTLSISENVQTQASISERLNSYYKGLGVYNKRVSEAIDNFNSYYLSKKAKREEVAQASKELQERIAKARSLLQDLMTSPSEELSPQDYTRAQCMYDALAVLEERISVINECWSIDLSYDNPKENKDAILQPLRTTSLKTLKNEFDQLYAQAQRYNGKQKNLQEK